MLEKYWIWGERDQLDSARSPGRCNTACASRSEPEIAEEMIERRREKLVLDALQDVVRSLRGAREERKAILTISNGWRLFRPKRYAAARARRPPSAGWPASRGHRPAYRPDHDRRQDIASGHRRSRPLRPRSHGPRPDRQRPATARHRRGSEPRQRHVLSARSARPRRVRRADHEAGRQRTAAAASAAKRRSGAPGRTTRIAARAGGRHRRDGDRPDQRSRGRVPAHRRRSLVVLPARVLLGRERWMAASTRFASG